MTAVDISDCYDVRDIYAFYPSFFKGCGRSIRKLYQIRGIPEEDYVFVKRNTRREGEWLISHFRDSRSNLLIKKLWVRENIPDFDEEEFENGREFLSKEEKEERERERERKERKKNNK